MRYRRASPPDVYRDDLQALILRGLQFSGDDLELDQDKLFASCAAMCVFPHYAAVAEDGDRIVAYIGGLVGEHPWFPGNQVIVMGWYSRTSWAGMRLLSMLVAWAREQKDMNTILVQVNPREGERLQQVFKRRGIDSYLGVGLNLKV